jgi:O-antigen/teichoic acid export membrane protein
MIGRIPFSIQPSQAGAVLKRLRHSTVAWSWVANGLRLAIGVFLLPLVLHKLSTEELGMYYVLLSLVALAPVIDFGFSPTIVRFVSYAMGGAETIQPQGFARATTASPNRQLLSQLFFTTRSLYRYMAVVVLVLVGAWGTYMVELRVHETPFPTVTRVAWAITLVATVFDIYSNWAVIFLRGMNEVLVSVQISVLASVVKFVVAAALLLGGGGLMSLPLGSLVGSLLQQSLARWQCCKRLGSHALPEAVHIWQNLRILWPNSWRLGLMTLSTCLTSQANTAICLKVLGLAENAQYGLSGQLVGIISGMAAVWTTVKWQLIGQYRAQHDYATMRRVLWPRFWLQHLTFLALAGGLILCGPPLLRWFGSGKQMLPLSWLVLLALYSFVELHLSFWAALISTENRIPFLWPGLATSLLGLSLSLALIHFTSLGIGALVLAPLLAGSLFNYWYWPLVGARCLDKSFFRFLCGSPRHVPPQPATTA